MAPPLWVAAALAILAPAAACSSGSTPAASSNQLVSAGLSAEKAGNVSEALADYKSAARDDPNNKFAHYDLGYVYQIRGDDSDAAAEYLEALRIDPRFAQPLYNMGVLQSKSNPASAISYYERELASDPTDASGNFNLGVLLVQQGQTNTGDLYIEKGVQLNPALASALPPGISLPKPTTPSTTTTIAR